MNYIQGESRKQYTMFPNVMDDYIDENNPARAIDIFVDSLNVIEMGFDKAIISATGRPPYSPKDLLKLYIYGYFNRIRSSRRLETESKRNIEVIWLLRNLSPDHKTISKFRKDNSVAIRNVFRTFVRLCIKLGLYGKELIAIDGSKFTAVNSKDRNFNVQKLEERLTNIDNKINKYLLELDENDKFEKKDTETEDISEKLEVLKNRKEKYENMLKGLTENCETQVSLTDPDSRRIKSANGAAIVGYNVQTAVDGKNSLIIDFEVTNNSNDKGCLHSLASKCKTELDVAGELIVLADKGYDSTTDIANCLVDNIKANVCMDINEFDMCIETDKDSSKPTEHKNGRFVYLKSRNIVICPMGEVLTPRSYRKSKRRTRFYDSRVCRKCSCKCTKSEYIQHEVYMPFKDFSKEYNIEGLKIKQIRYVPDKLLLKRRKCIVEYPFGVVKRCMDADYLLTKGFKNVDSEFSLAYLVYNLKRAINLIGINKLIPILMTI